MLPFSDIRQLALEVGLDDIGFAPAVRLDEEAMYLQRWLSAGCQGSMAYMERNVEKRLDPRLLVPGTKTVLVGVLSYYKEYHQPPHAPYIAMSGISREDYHQVVKEKLLQLAERLRQRYGDGLFDDSLQYVFCDSAPVLERAWGRRAGLGFVGKNRQFIHPRFGSFVHLGELFLREEVSDDEEAALSAKKETERMGCGDCQRCLQACPTGAIREEGMDARRCVSYLTIERREPMPEMFRGQPYIGLYGCDCCQRACPYNQNIPADLHPELAANPLLLQMTAEDWATASKRQKQKLLRRLAN